VSTDRTLSTYDDGEPSLLNVAQELTMAARILNETAGASIYDDSDMIRSAVALRMRLRGLTAAVRAERGEDR
jgi:hypothetical protein